jgi:AcrR family transcriptional regulator
VTYAPFNFGHIVAGAEWKDRAGIVVAYGKCLTFSRTIPLMAAAQAPLGLRERKKQQTRDTILAVATRLFESRGYERVTVAEIADAANISVKTLFTYFRSKEDLAFADEQGFRDQLVRAVRDRPDGVTPVQAVARLLETELDSNADGAEGLEGYHRRVTGSDALESRLRKMWSGYEDALAEVLAAEQTGPDAAARGQLAATMLTGLVRSVTSAEVLASVRRHRSVAARRAALQQWVATAETLVSCLERAWPEGRR